MEKELTETVIGCAMKVHRALGPGFLESVYQNALLVELKREGLFVEAQQPLQVRYEGVIVGNFLADLVVNEALILELKATTSLSRADEQQLVNYLKATGHRPASQLRRGKPRIPAQVPNPSNSCQSCESC